MPKPTRGSKEWLLERIKVDPKTGCWIWQRSVIQTSGYGQTGLKPPTAHRLAYTLWKGEPTLPIVRHSCHVRLCCNPEHLSEGTSYDNWHDSESAHAEKHAKQVGRIAVNRIPVIVKGVRYPSMVAAQRSLGVSYKGLRKMIA
jgi:hypothetical protein